MSKDLSGKKRPQWIQNLSTILNPSKDERLNRFKTFRPELGDAFDFSFHDDGNCREFSSADYDIIHSDYMVEGCRHANEDRSYVNLSIEVRTENFRRELSGFAVFDGHGGKNCAEFLKQNIERSISSGKIWSRRKDSLQEKMTASLKFAIDEIEAGVLDMQRETGDKSGSCLIITLYCQGFICTANVGDSMGYLYLPKTENFPEKIIQLSQPHRAKVKSESDRIEQFNGYINNSRVFGVLEPSRSIGDIDIKNFRPGAVISEPFICSVALPPPFVSRDSNSNSVSLLERPLLLLASDGLWDVAPISDVFNACFSYMRSWKKSSTEPGNKYCKKFARKLASPNLARHLVREALRHGTFDDVTVIAIHFDF